LSIQVLKIGLELGPKINQKPKISQHTFQQVFWWNVVIIVKTPYRNSWFNRISFFPMFFLPCLLSSCHLIVSNTRKLDSDWNKFYIAKFEIIFILFNGVFFVIVEISSKIEIQSLITLKSKWTFGFFNLKNLIKTSRFHSNW
jgi:hypothetical protein